MIIWLFYVTIIIIIIIIIMQHLGVNFGGILRFKLGFFICFLFFLRKKSGLIFKSPVATLRPTGSLRHVLFTPNV